RALPGALPVVDGGGHLGDVADLAGQVARHQVHVVRQVFPDAADGPHLGLPAELALGADLTGHARDLAGECVELVDHRVDGVFQLEDLAANVDGDLLREVALLDGGGDLGDVADLAGQVARHKVHVVGQVFPDTGHPAHVRLAAQLAFGTDLPRDARHLTGKRVELADHGIHSL